MTDQDLHTDYDVFIELVKEDLDLARQHTDDDNKAYWLTQAELCVEKARENHD